MAQKIRASLIGSTGYAGAELIRRLLTHPRVELSKIASVDNIGENIGKVHKNFGNRLPYVFEDIPPEEVAKHSDVVFLALPHKVSFSMVPKLFPSGVKIIDLSGDYRLRDAAIYEKFYGAAHSNPENINSFVYGLPELNREKIKTANRIANPGCFPTATALSLLPLAKAGLLKGKARVVGPTGSSGSGVAAKAETHHPTRSVNLRSYKPLNHQHQPEMEQAMRDAGAKDFFIDFIPMSAPVSRGILINSIVDLPAHVSYADIEAIYKDYYKNEPFTRVLPKGSFPDTNAILHTNYVEIGLAMKEEQGGTKSFAAICSIDNLVRGASGQAIHNMNLMFGFDETLALQEFGPWP